MLRIVLTVNAAGYVSVIATCHVLKEIKNEIRKGYYRRVEWYIVTDV
jgi:uncharacterized protein YeeX (DUF496 family)